HSWPHWWPRLAPDARERLGARIRTEGAGNFLWDLEHAQVLLGLVVVEGDGAVVEEGEHRRLVHPEALEQVAWGGLLGATLLLPRWSLRRRIGRQPPGQHLLIARDEGVACGPVQPLLALGASALHRCFPRQQQGLELLGPGLLVGLFDES